MSNPFLIVPKGAIAVFLIVASSWATVRQAGAQGLMITGYADLEASWNNPAGSGDSEFFFDNHHFNVIAIGEIYGGLFAGAEVEYEHAGDEIALEYGYLSYVGFKDIRIVAGKFIVPFGRFNKDLHPSWINKMIDRPHGFNNILPQTYSDVGLWISGAGVLSQRTRLVYDVFAVNGLMGADGGDIRGMRDNARDRFPEGGTDNNKALGGRLGVELPPEGVDFGGSIYYGRYSENPNNDLVLLLLGADAAYRNAGFEVRGEIVHGNQEATGGDLKKTGGYVQAAYLIGSRVEPVLRFSARNMPGESMDQSRFSLGANYYVSAAASVRLNYHINIEKSDFESDNDVLGLQFNVVF